GDETAEQIFDFKLQRWHEREQQRRRRRLIEQRGAGAVVDEAGAAEEYLLEVVDRSGGERLATPRRALHHGDLVDRESRRQQVEPEDTRQQRRRIEREDRPQPERHVWQAVDIRRIDDPHAVQSSWRQ